MKKNTSMYTFGLTIVLFSSTIIACGGGGSDSSGEQNTPTVSADPSTPGTTAQGEPEDANVVSIALEKPSFPVGEFSTVNLTVTYAESRVLQGGEKVVVVVKLPAGVSYERDSSGITTTSSSTNTAPTQLDCANGESFIAYDLGSTELKGSEDPDGRLDADFNLIFAIEGAAQSGLSIISASAADNALVYSCEGSFDEEVSTSVTVQ